MPRQGRATKEEIAICNSLLPPRDANAMHITPCVDKIIQITLLPGELYFGRENTCISTLLGSCVSVTMWHPKLHIGGMCHFVLPAHTSGSTTGHPDPRYAEDAIALMIKHVQQMGTSPAEYQVKLFGGASMFTACADMSVCIGNENIRAAKAWIKQYGLKVHAEHLGGNGHRNIYFEIKTGRVQVRQHVITGLESDTIALCLL